MTVSITKGCKLVCKCSCFLTRSGVFEKQECRLQLAFSQFFFMLYIQAYGVHPFVSKHFSSCTNDKCEWVTDNRHLSFFCKSGVIRQNGVKKTQDYVWTNALRKCHATIAGLTRKRICFRFHLPCIRIADLYYVHTIVHFVMQFLTWHFNESKYLIGAWISNMDSRWGKQKCMWGIQFVRKTCKYVCKCNIAVLCTYNNTKKNNFELLFFPCIVMAIGWGSKKRPLYARTSLKVVSWVIHNKEPQFFQSFASRNKNSHTYVMSLRF